MYRLIKIGNEEYKLEYSVEASLYCECVESITNLMFTASTSENIRDMIKEISNLPNTTLTLFYAGLMEHHGVDAGDGKVPNIKVAKELAVQYFKEHKEDGTGNWFELMNMCMEQVGEDSFFDLIGIHQMME